MESLFDLGRGVPIGFKGFDEMLFFNGKGLRRRDLNGLGNEGFKHNRLLRRMMMRLMARVDMEVPIGISLLPIELLGKRAIGEVRDCSVVLINLN